MRELVGDLLEYSRVGSRGRPFAPVDLNRVMDVVLETIKGSVRESGAEVRVDQLPTVMADRTQIVQVMQNLLTNAIKFNDSAPPRITVTAAPAPEEWIISVQDNGIGIDPKHAERIFQMCQRLHTRDEYPGTGIGLAIVRKVVERHGGRIWMESEVGKGTTFRFTLLNLGPTPPST